jgi:hypothetical protein
MLLLERNLDEIGRGLDDRKSIDCFSKELCYYYYLRVTNDNESKAAMNCLAYLRSLFRILEHGREEQPLYPVEKYKNDWENVELKWTGVNLKEVTIGPKEYRHLDFLYIKQNSSSLYLGVNYNLIDNDELKKRYVIEEYGNYEIEIVVYSLNFPPEIQKFLFHYTNDTRVHNERDKNECKICKEINA